MFFSLRFFFNFLFFFFALTPNNEVTSCSFPWEWKFLDEPLLMPKGRSARIRESFNFDLKPRKKGQTECCLRYLNISAVRFVRSGYSHLQTQAILQCVIHSVYYVMVSGWWLPLYKNCKKIAENQSFLVLVAWLARAYGCHWLGSKSLASTK